MIKCPRKVTLVMLGVFLTTGCVPRIEVTTPKDPVVINMNVKIEHEISIKASDDMEKLLKERSNLLEATQ